VAAFWVDSDWAQNYTSKPFDDALLTSIEEELGYRLPNAFVQLMRDRNGGVPVNQSFPTAQATSWAEDHIAIDGIYGIGRDKGYALCGGMGSAFMIEEWGYPPLGVYFGSCPSAGHDMVALDYRACGPRGEPQVVHVDQSREYAITVLAPNLQAFVDGLVHESVFEPDPEEELNNALATVREGAFSAALSAILEVEPAWGPALRALCARLTREKGYFALHGDPDSWLVYDAIFSLASRANAFATPDAYLSAYPEYVVLSGAGFTTGGHAPSFIEDWLRKRQNEELILLQGGRLQFRPGYTAVVGRKMAEVTS